MATLDKGTVLDGTFSGTGASNAVWTLPGGKLTLEFGAGTVELRRYNAASDNFAPTGDSWTANAVKIIETEGLYDLNCSAHSGNIRYTLEPTTR